MESMTSSAAPILNDAASLRPSSSVTTLSAVPIGVSKFTSVSACTSISTSTISSEPCNEVQKHRKVSNESSSFNSVSISVPLSATITSDDGSLSLSSYSSKKNTSKNDAFSASLGRDAPPSSVSDAATSASYSSSVKASTVNYKPHKSNGKHNSDGSEEDKTISSSPDTHKRTMLNAKPNPANAKDGAFKITLDTTRNYHYNDDEKESAALALSALFNSGSTASAQKEAGTNEAETKPEITAQIQDQVPAPTEGIHESASAKGESKANACAIQCTSIKSSSDVDTNLSTSSHSARTVSPIMGAAPTAGVSTKSQSSTALEKDADLNLVSDKRAETPSGTYPNQKREDVKDKNSHMNSKQSKTSVSSIPVSTTISTTTTTTAQSSPSTTGSNSNSNSCSFNNPTAKDFKPNHSSSTSQVINKSTRNLYRDAILPKLLQKNKLNSEQPSSSTNTIASSCSSFSSHPPSKKSKLNSNAALPTVTQEENEEGTTASSDAASMNTRLLQSQESLPSMSNSPIHPNNNSHPIHPHPLQQNMHSYSHRAPPRHLYTRHPYSVAIHRVGGGSGSASNSNHSHGSLGADGSGRPSPFNSSTPSSSSFFSNHPPPNIMTRRRSGSGHERGYASLVTGSGANGIASSPPPYHPVYSSSDAPLPHSHYPPNHGFSGPSNGANCTTTGGVPNPGVPPSSGYYANKQLSAGTGPGAVLSRPPPHHHLHSGGHHHIHHHHHHHHHHNSKRSSITAYGGVGEIPGESHGNSNSGNSNMSKGNGFDACGEKENGTKKCGAMRSLAQTMENNCGKSNNDKSSCKSGAEGDDKETKNGDKKRKGKVERKGGRANSVEPMVSLSMERSGQDNGKINSSGISGAKGAKIPLYVEGPNSFSNGGDSMQLRPPTHYHHHDGGANGGGNYYNSYPSHPAISHVTPSPHRHAPAHHHHHGGFYHPPPHYPPHHTYPSGPRDFPVMDVHGTGSQFNTPAKLQGSNNIVQGSNIISPMPTPFSKQKPYDKVSPIEIHSNNLSSNNVNTNNVNNYSRKDKSLGLLCENFMTKYSSLSATSHDPKNTLANAPPNPAISIDVAAKALGVERRRIYDIINILEAIRIVSRKCKNTYYWHGPEGLLDTFVDMQQEAMVVWREDAIKNGLLTIEKDHSKDGDDVCDGDGNNNPDDDCSGVAMLLASAKQVNAASKTRRPYSEELKSSNHKEKSLGKLSQKFIQLFLVGYNVIGLTDASDKILGPSAEIPPKTLHKGATKAEELAARAAAAAASRSLKTKIRRLYDIANVMVSVGIIEKMNSGNNMSNSSKNRPSFKWVYGISPKDILERHIRKIKGEGTVSVEKSGANFDGALGKPCTVVSSFGEDNSNAVNRNPPWSSPLPNKGPRDNACSASNGSDTIMANINKHGADDGECNENGKTSNDSSTTPTTIIAKIDDQ